MQHRRHDDFVVKIYKNQNEQKNDHLQRRERRSLKKKNNVTIMQLIKSDFD